MSRDPHVTQWLLHVARTVTFTFRVLPTHTAHIYCLVRYCINRPDFVIEVVCVYCVVRTGSWYKVLFRKIVYLCCLSLYLVVFLAVSLTVFALKIFSLCEVHSAWSAKRTVAVCANWNHCWVEKSSERKLQHLVCRIARVFSCLLFNCLHSRRLGDHSVPFFRLRQKTYRTVRGAGWAIPRNDLEICHGHFQILWNFHLIVHCMSLRWMTCT